MKLNRFLSFGAVLAGAACGIALSSELKRRRYSFAGRTVVITGGSRGLGLIMARRLAREGAKLSILARNLDSLQRAEAELTELGAEVLALSCDVRQEEEAHTAIAKIVQRFGTVDVLINNAGIIQAGPLEHMRVKDFQDALATHLLGPLHCTLAVLPHMRRAKQGRITNIASIGGKIAVPHLVPYCASKFALVGLSDALRVELRRHNIRVTTVCPGLMRTGSARNASFKGQHLREYAWFAVSDSLPWLSMDAERAAEKIINACRRGASRLVLGIHMKGAVLMNELFPGAMTGMLSAANVLLPGPSPESLGEAHTGVESQSALAPSWLTRLSDRAAFRNNEIQP